MTSTDPDADPGPAADPAAAGADEGAPAGRLVAAGPGALYLALDAPGGAATAARLEALRRALRPGAPAAVRDLLAGSSGLLAEFRPGSDPAPVRAWLEGALAADPPPLEPARHTLGVRYGEAADREALEAALELSFDEIARRHAAAEYTVAFLGFTAGFPYLLGLPEALRLPRRRHPEGRIPPGAVAVAGGFGGVYPAESPGGWWVLGRTDARLFDARRDPPALLAPGDRVRFEARAELEPPATGSDAPLGDGPLEILDAWPRSLSVQAGPRWSWGHLGLAQAGALDGVAAEQANDALGNGRDAAVLELLGNPARLVAHEALEAALAGGGFRAALDGEPLRFRQAFRWPAGATLELTPVPGGFCSYLALAGGVRAEAWGGSRSSDVRAGVGGARRFLRAGDRLASAGEAAGPRRPRPERVRWPERIALPLHPGPQFDAGAFDVLLGSSFRVAGLDRTGCRLAGPSVALPEHEVASEGSPWGALQVPPSGSPVVLLADRGRTGGYAKPAVVDPRELWRLAQARPGTEVWFVDGREGARAGARTSGSALPAPAPPSDRAS